MDNQVTCFLGKLFTQELGDPFDSAFWILNEKDKYNK